MNIFLAGEHPVKNGKVALTTGGGYNMNLFIAGTMSRPYVTESGEGFKILESFYYCRDNEVIPKLLPILGDFLLDSGNYYSMCEHHMMPFFGKYIFAYIPNPKGKILGLSKIGRVVDYYSARLQVQERLVADIVEDITRALGSEYPPLGVALIMQGEHLCKTMRGVKKPGLMFASRLDGVFREDKGVRSEFLTLARELLGK